MDEAISVQQLPEACGQDFGPPVHDVRPKSTSGAAAQAISGALHRDLERIETWWRGLDLGFVKGAYAAALGTALGACFLLNIVIGLALIFSLAVLFRRKVSNQLLIAAAAIVGLIAFPLLVDELRGDSRSASRLFGG